MESRMMETEAARKEELEKKGKVEEVERNIWELQSGLKMAENIIKEGTNPEESFQPRCVNTNQHEGVYWY